MSEPQPKGLDVEYIAKLARLELTAEEKASYQSQLNDVLDYVRQLQELDVSGVEPTAHAVPVHNVFREDCERPCLDHEAVMENAPDQRADHFLVPRIIE
ncbi:MAG: Asp-tRNA(Asn)/Glu-tRNA(Gln) amidotransferase subunit GatC [Kiritimatiellae bacterium]|nr:Asp-tRNA(Asn)/Glu-tRNA(Gln) amidotransferase subunit GatC [Kiritimatiellia bacterium]